MSSVYDNYLQRLQQEITEEITSEIDTEIINDIRINIPNLLNLIFNDNELTPHTRWKTPTKTEKVNWKEEGF